MSVPAPFGPRPVAMSGTTSATDVAIVGAGAAGLGAARTLAGLGVDFVMLEASHRIGGRAHTEDVGRGQPFDLGCHWLHSASINPFTRLADELGFTYKKTPFLRRIHLGDRWASAAEKAERDAFFERNFERVDAAAAAGRDVPVSDVTERESRWTVEFDYVMSLLYSTDSDLVSTHDHSAYNDTEENWPVREGYGRLVARVGADLPVTLNCEVTRIVWHGKDIRLSSPQGDLRARRVIVTVSTGVLGDGHIAFDPPLPDWKQQAIADLPVGNHNRICLVLDGRQHDEDLPEGGVLLDGESEPMALRLRPFGYDYVVGLTGGRFADWLERAGPEASVDLAVENLKKLVGNGIAKHIVGDNVTAWRGDPWVRGAYSAARPGAGHQRRELARPLDERLYFAGEATSAEFFSTAHGAYLSGIAAAEAAAASLDRGVGVGSQDA